MDDLNNPLMLDKEYNPEKKKNSNYLRKLRNEINDELQKKSFKLLEEEEKLPPDTEKIIQEAEKNLLSKKEIIEKNEETIIKDLDADTKKLKQIKIKHNLEKDFIEARKETLEVTLKINQFIKEHEKQLKLLYKEGSEIDQNMLNFERKKNQLQVEFIDKQKKLIKKSEEEIKGLKNLNEEYKEKITSSEEVISNFKPKEEEFINLNQEYQEKITSLEKVINNFKPKEEEIKFYQNDNLRLSNKLFETSKRLEDTKQQINEFENKKIQIQEQILDLNKIISKNNIVKEQFPQNNNIQNISNTAIKKKSDIESSLISKNHEEINEELDDIDIETKKIFS